MHLPVYENVCTCYDAVNSEPLNTLGSVHGALKERYKNMDSNEMRKK